MLRNLVQRSTLTQSNLFRKNIESAVVCMNQVRTKTNKRVRRPHPLPNVKYEAMSKSLEYKGYLRAQDPYTPPDNVVEIVQRVKSESGISSGFDGKSFTLDDKFAFLSQCGKEFERTVPNSVLHEMNTIDDVIAFYETPVNTFLPLDELMTRQQELPPNLHIEQKYHRFNPETDTMFNGLSAFPKSSTIVTGIKYRKKYAGYEAKRSWP